ncbi:hypothetical protein [Aneurinibacillus tyrosinisolvens]|uniref:hypothetical protein n=1 Tax=Aneurinibacillus tyrosinisolvens TaxID=1443435 RepID=UPI00063F2423|nr:hypothetical protein [Aneurinibacillus tyrosinisolvens]
MQNEHDTSVLVDFFAERDAKQRYFDDIHRHLMEKLREYMSQSVNLREKVRAKHLFRSHVDLNPEALLIPFWEAQFGIWLLLEYQNIKGERTIERFLLEQHTDLSEVEMHLSAHWMAAYPSVYQVAEESEEGYRLVDLWSEDTIEVALREEEYVRSEFIVGQYIFARVAKVGFLHRFIGPYALINKECVSPIKENMETSFNSRKEENGHRSWRLFMQHHGIEVLRMHQ